MTISQRWTVAAARSLSVLWLLEAGWIAVVFFTSMAVGADPPALVLGWAATSAIMAVVALVAGPRKRILQASATVAAILAAIGGYLWSTVSPDFQLGLGVGIVLAATILISALALLRLGTDAPDQHEPITG